MSATPHDADLILKLYELRREPEMRKARTFLGFQFWPNTYDDVIRTVGVMGSDENRYFRQAVSFWEMATSLVLHGTLNEQIFLANADEAFFFYAKLKPFRQEAINRNGFEPFANLTQLMEQSPEAQKKLAAIEQRVALVKQRIAAQAQAQMAKAS